MTKLIALVLIGLSVGMGNFAASIAIGLGGVNRSLRIRIALVFGIFETGMPIIGLLIGQRFALLLGNKANLIGSSLLILTGLYVIIGKFRKVDNKDVNFATQGWTKLLLAGLSLSIDNLIVGFSLGTRHQSILLSVVIIGLSSIILALLGLEIGNRLNDRIEGYSELFSGSILILVGILIALRIL